MASTFEIVVDADAKQYSDAKEAGAAFFAADITKRPYVVHSSEQNFARGMAGTAIHGKYPDGETRYVRVLPNSHDVDKDFRAGYMQALEKSVTERLKNTDWERAALDPATRAVKLDNRLHDDLETLARVDLAKAAKAWEDHAGKDRVAPAFLDRDQAREAPAVIDVAARGPAYGVIQIDDKPATSIRYERFVEGDKASFDVSFHMGVKTVARFKDLDVDALIDAVGGKNAKAIAEQTTAKGTLRGEDLVNENGISPEESSRRAQMRDAQKTVEVERLEPDRPEERNVVEQAPEREQELASLDPDALARAALARQHDRERFEREQLARDPERAGKPVEAKQVDLEKPAERREAAARDDLGASPSPAGAAELTEREKNRRMELLDQVHDQFRVSGAKYLFKDQPGKVAFKDKGERMVSASNDDRVAKAMATMAEAKGWKTLKVSGHPDFQREVWMEASLRGLEVRGFKPSEQDLKSLEARLERGMQNKVEKTVDAREQGQQRAPVERPLRDRDNPRTRDIMDVMADIDRKKETAQRKPREQGQEAPERAQPAARAAGKETEAHAPDSALRAYAGRVLEHGSAKYNHDPEEKQSYFVRLATPAGEKTVWGIDLKRAMAESKAKLGDAVNLEFKGNVPVTVEANKRDKAGKVIGKEEIDTHRNAWEVTKSDKHKVVEAVAAAVIDAKVKDPAQRQALKAAVDARLVERAKVGKVPSVAVYDKDAPTKAPQPERTGPVVERNAERTR
ncbi:LPD7 domain-containing protein [Massilia sp. DWR3-1-1]|uniref:LPD7 domain-containing protein n=1 Tax=Massilia sp. DWR3-1-1 TaxID=2804559 RepID=UPI003CF9E825